MSKLTLAKDLYAKVALLVAPEVEATAVEVEREAKRIAPATKQWESQRDARVRHTHVGADNKYGSKDKALPDNLRFEVTSMDWDRENLGLGPITYMKEPRDRSSGAYVNLVNCRCYTVVHPDGMAEFISSTPAKVTGSEVSALAVAEGEHVLKAEYGDEYPGGLVAKGTMFMHRAAANTAVRRRIRTRG